MIRSLPIRVGASSEFVAFTAGQLYLAVNDWGYSDNLGYYSSEHMTLPPDAKSPQVDCP